MPHLTLLDQSHPVEPILIVEAKHWSGWYQLTGSAPVLWPKWLLPVAARRAHNPDPPSLQLVALRSEFTDLA